MEYRPWDREEKLGPPPWCSDDPSVAAWEQAHGHDVRLKCYPEHGCHLRDAWIEEAARRVITDVDSSVATADLPPMHTLKVNIEELRTALDA